MVALQGLTTLSWASFNINPHYIAAAAQGIAYVHLLLYFMLYNAAPLSNTNGDQNAQVLPRDPRMPNPGGGGTRG
jgi:hypothetical protein